MSKSLIVLVDTDPSTIDLADSNAVLEHFAPDEVRLSTLKEADLILIDYVIDDWSEQLRDEVPLLARPVDGLTLAHSVRRLLHKSEDHKPPAVALITSEYEKAANPLSASTPPHLLARLNGIEWVFTKTAHPKAVADLACAMSDSLYQIASEPSETLRVRQLLAYLGIKADAEKDFYEAEVLFAQPPLAQLAKWNDGLLILRWLLHRVLPYPTFLVGDSYLASRANCNLQELTAAINRKGACGITSSIYSGPGSQLFSRRFWRAGLERIFYEVLGATHFNPTEVRKMLSEQLGEELTPNDFESCELYDPATGYGSSIGNIVSTRETHVDDWPSYADSPRTLNE